MKPYRPSNGTEGMIFMEDWCDQCAKSDGCQIVLASMAYHVDNPLYPPEWIEDDRGQRCTAFREEGTPEPVKPCPGQKEMF